MLGIWVRVRCFTCSQPARRNSEGLRRAGACRGCRPTAARQQQHAGHGMERSNAAKLQDRRCWLLHGQLSRTRRPARRWTPMAAVAPTHLQAGLAAKAAAQVHRLPQHLLRRLVLDIHMPRCPVNCTRNKEARPCPGMRAAQHVQHAAQQAVRKRAQAQQRTDAGKAQDRRKRGSGDNCELRRQQRLTVFCLQPRVLAAPHHALDRYLRVVTLEVRQYLLHKLPAEAWRGGRRGAAGWRSAAGMCGVDATANSAHCKPWVACRDSPRAPAAAAKVAIVHQQLLQLPNPSPRHRCVCSKRLAPWTRQKKRGCKEAVGWAALCGWRSAGDGDKAMQGARWWQAA